MILPKDVAKAAKQKERQNMRFRTYLKGHAEEEALDAQFLYWHEHYFKTYDCSQCRNCCKMFHGEIPEEELEQDAKFLGYTKEEFINKYLQFKDSSYQTKHKPCDFLQKDGSCLLNDHKPENCKNYPYTNQPDRLWSLYSILSATFVCPVAYEIVERLKEEYDFK